MRCLNGQMTERPKVHDWKSCVPPKGTVGSNPTLSAITKRTPLAGVLLVCRFIRLDGDNDIFGATAGFEFYGPV